MSSVFEVYKPRTIQFSELLNSSDWAIKIYTITNKPEFASDQILQNCKRHLPVWLGQIENAKLPTYRQAFLIIHEAREGVWILLNWWTGGEMVESKVFFSSFDTPDIITDSPYNTNSLLCVWELEVFAHERASWIKHILSKANQPDYIGYIKATFCKAV
ncbi:hypothetical protein [Croceitalea rosinachiae]|uniref:Uncharacterized protein n=1 Tax=Croceitalea rosinachiae TaxID=3075596 RepID=A0ABU3AE55_9FLAO|nr:hypothetical protein [Croceitalea sp. F388]MDT0608466.1 hypothetical protein [Croceitalea sp. F388]